MIIEELHLESFKGFEDFTLKCSQFTALVGPNSGGKTSILEAIQFLHDILLWSLEHGSEGQTEVGRWTLDPTKTIKRASPADPEAMWLRKKTSAPCKICATYSGGVQLLLDITSPSSYELQVRTNGEARTTGATIVPPIDQDVIDDIIARGPTYLPPGGALSPLENYITHSELQRKLDEGRTPECWRVQLWWRYNDGNPEDFDTVVETVNRYLPSAKILRPKHSHDAPARIVIEFEEDGTILDISSSGGGLRTLLDLASILRLSDSKCLMFDEPDAHLHGTLQREVARMLMDHALENNVQVFVATHAPEFLAEVPTDSLVWIDRKDSQGRVCSGIGTVLADLGCITNADAIRAYGADKILFVEDNLTRGILEQLLARSRAWQRVDEQSLIAARLPSGKGDAKSVSDFPKLLREAFCIDARIACVTDSDYDLHAEPAESTTDRSAPLFLRLDRKEIENYLLEPDVIVKAAKAAARERQEKMSVPVQTPVAEEVRAQIRTILDDPSIRDIVKCQVRPRYRDRLPDSFDDATREQEAEEWFDGKWRDPEWPIKHGPGKRVLRRLRQWCQDKFSLTLTNSKLIEALDECPPDIEQIAQDLASHFCDD